MVAVDTSVVGMVIGAAGLLLAYGLSLWQVFKSDPGDRFVRCASITIIIWALTRPTRAAIKTHFFPDWVLTSLLILLCLLTFLSIFFMFQEGYRAARRRYRALRRHKRRLESAKSN
jgi:hypothetical protein